jgi:hypothetical protein
MVRAHMKQSSEEKKETPRKKTPSKKKAVVTGVWPCKINGCNKQFAREADLKRHQRTTKLHSMPGFACPQCDATFTRTDALRRHQKSRHNGVIIEPNEGEKSKEDGEEDGQSAGSQSRSASPATKGKEKQTTAIPPHPNALAQPASAGPSGGYYRQHTATNGAFIPPPRPLASAIMEGQYSQSIALPTSATRLHQANWVPPPWGSEGPPPHMGSISYHQIPGPHPYFQSSAYYRPAMVPPPPLPHQSQINPDLVNGQNVNGNSSQSNEPNTIPSMHNDVDSPASHNGLGQKAPPDVEMATARSPPTAPVIDPSLDVPTPGPKQASNSSTPQFAPNSTLGVPDEILSLHITQAAMEAVLESAARQIAEGSTTEATDNFRRADGNHTDDGEADAEGEADAGGDEERSLSSHLKSDITPGTFAEPSTTRQSTRPEPMEHMLTEDGEPMLNPAELLTQESLASPPPS